MKNQSGVYVLGGGAHGKVVVSTLLEAGWNIAGILDENQLLWGSSVMDIKVMGSFDILEDLEKPEAIIAIGANAVRKTIASRFEHVRWMTVIHPSAYVHPSVKLGHGSTVFAGSVVQPDVVIGDHSIINSSCSIDHDSIIADFVHCGPGTVLGSNVNLEEGAFMGINSSALPEVSVGAWSIVGAGGVAIRDIPPRSLAIGVPARTYTDRSPLDDSQGP